MIALDGARILISQADGPLGRRLAAALAHGPGSPVVAPLEAAGVPAAGDLVVFLAPPSAPARGATSARGAALEWFLDRPEASGLRALVVQSSTLVYGAREKNAGRLSEGHPLFGEEGGRHVSGLIRAERAARAFARARPDAAVTILRTAPILAPDDLFGRLFLERAAVRVAGYDPPLQFLHPEDAVEAIRLALARPPGLAVFNVAPRDVVGLGSALRLAGCRPVARLPGRARARAEASGADPDQLAYLRYRCVTDGTAAERDLGFRPKQASLDAIEAFLSEHRASGLDVAALERRAIRLRDPDARDRYFDEFGFDPAFLHRRCGPLLEFLFRRWWRVGLTGLEHVPPRGRAMLVSNHSGVLMWDALMLLWGLATRLRPPRYVRFLVHSWLLKPPFVAPVFAKLGGVLACAENGELVLNQDGLLGVFPEGTDGPWKPFRERYRLREFGRNRFVRMALSTGSPIVPCVVIGAEEIYCLLGKSERLASALRLPVFPITPLFPWVPPPVSMIPFPTKWQIAFLPPIDLAARHEPGAARDTHLVRRLGNEIHDRMQAELSARAAARRHLFW